MEGALERDDPHALGRAIDGVIFARAFDRAFHRLRARIAEESVFGKAGGGAEPLGEPFAFRNAKQVGDVDELGGLLGDRLRDVRVRMAERVHGDAGGEIEVALAVGRDEPGAFAPLEAEVDACECRQEMRRHDVARFSCFAHAPAKALPPGIRSGRRRLASCASFNLVAK